MSNVPLDDIPILSERDVMLLDAAIDNNIEVIEQAIEDGVILDDVVDEDGSALLYVALENKHVELIQTIIRTGKCNINRVNNLGLTCLMRACDMGEVTLVKIFLDSGAKIDISDSNGWTCFHYACRIGDAPVISILLARFPEFINLEAKDGSTGLLIASHFDASIGIKDDTESKHVETCQYLLQSGADVDAQLESGQTSLMIATNDENIEIINVLLDNDADTQILDNNDKKALDYAKDTHNARIIRKLKKLEPIKMKVPERTSKSTCIVQ